MYGPLVGFLHETTFYDVAVKRNKGKKNAAGPVNG